jgi:hypothetical protein
VRLKSRRAGWNGGAKTPHGGPVSGGTSANAGPDEWRVVSTFQPGERGTQRLLREWGHRLFCVRYRYNPNLKRRIKTAEIVVDEAPWRRKKGAEVGVAVRSWENHLRHAIVEAGGRWDRELGLWVLPKARAVGMGLQDRAKNIQRPSSTDPSEVNISGNREVNSDGNIPSPAANTGNRP